MAEDNLKEITVTVSNETVLLLKNTIPCDENPDIAIKMFGGILLEAACRMFDAGYMELKDGCIECKTKKGRFRLKLT